jgi:cytidylate kinase
MYRAVAWRARHAGLDLGDPVPLAALAEAAVIDLGDRIEIDGHDVTEAIRTPVIDQAAAIVAQHSPVRAVLVARQREIGRQGGVVMEGRDIGTVVFPSAEVKVYLDASPEERARRRTLDAAHAAGRETGGVQGVAEALAARDQTDRTRAVSPLTVSGDAVYIDTTGLAVDDVVRQVMKLVDAKLATA